MLATPLANAQGGASAEHAISKLSVQVELSRNRAEPRFEPDTESIRTKRILFRWTTMSHQNWRSSCAYEFFSTCAASGLFFTFVQRNALKKFEFEYHRYEFRYSPYGIEPPRPGFLEFLGIESNRAEPSWTRASSSVRAAGLAQCQARTKKLETGPNLARLDSWLAGWSRSHRQAFTLYDRGHATQELYRSKRGSFSVLRLASHVCEIAREQSHSCRTEFCILPLCMWAWGTWGGGLRRQRYRDT